MNVFRSLVKPAPRGAQTPLDAADIDEAVAERVEKVTQSLLVYSTLPSHLAKDKPDDEGTKSRWETAHKAVRETIKTPLAWRVAGHTGGWMVGLACLGLFITFLRLVATIGESGWYTLLYAIVPGALGWAVLRAQDKAETRRKKEQARLPHLLAYTLPLIETKSAAEAAYCDGVVALLQTPKPCGQTETRAFLHDFKSLLETGRQARARRLDVEQAMGKQTLTDVEAEAVQITDCAAAVRDVRAREIFAAGLAHLEARRARLQTLEPLRERWEAREAATVQALKEAQSALALVPFFDAAADAASDETANAPASWNDTAHRLCQQTRSVERAMQEVLNAGNGIGRTQSVGG